MLIRTLILGLGLPQTLPPPPPAAPPRHVIVMIADGAGYSTLEATRAWTGAALTADDWQQCAMECSALRRRQDPGTADPLARVPEIAYDPERAWSAEPIDGERGNYPYHFDGYAWHRQTAPDSAATMSAIMTGQRTYNGAINVDGAGAPLVSVPELSHRLGRSCGVVTSVPFNHATAASGAGAHGLLRGHLHALAHEMLTAGTVRVIGGAGHPMFDDDGALRETPKYSYVDQDTWESLATGTLKDRHGATWTLVEDAGAIVELAHGPTPDRLCMIVPRAGTLQANRTSTGDPRELGPFDDPELTDVPQLRQLARAALNALDDDPDGMFLVIEGGAVDWAMHSNHLGRMIEEYIEFDEAVAEVIRFVDEHDRLNWTNTLVVVTADHDHLLYGPESDTIAFQPIEARGAGTLPGYLWHNDTHSNQLVPLFVRGAGSDDILAGADGRDPRRGAYLHQADLGDALLAFIRAADTPGAPEPAEGQASESP